MSTLVGLILHLQPWTVLLLVFAMPALESAAFVGFVFPGEITLVLAGVLASRGLVPLAAVLLLAVAGAIAGDSVGYAVGRRYGRRLLDGTVGRLVRAKHLDRAQTYVAERGGKAVFLGRFTAALRVLVPGVAGMSHMPYRRFLAYNVAGAVTWATGAVLLGLLGGSGWRHLEHLASQAGLVAWGLLVVLVVVGIVRHRRQLR